MTNDALKQISSEIKNHDDFILFSHVSPDGDTIGCCASLALMLREMGKKVQCVCHDKLPDVYCFLEGTSQFVQPQDATPAAVAIALDCADINRLGSAAELFENSQLKLAMDHHGTHIPFADITLVDPDTSAACMLVYKLVKELGLIPTQKAAEAMYTGIVTDTGSFAYTNTTPEALEIASKLLALGVDNSRIDRFVYKAVPYAKARITGYALSNTELLANGKIGITTITQEDLLHFHAKPEYVEGIVDRIRDIDTVEIAIFMRECMDGDYKVSMRSKEYADVAAIAGEFGGGGHVHAAGFRIGMDFDDLYESVLSSAKKHI